jgi:hypothetical protein
METSWETAGIALRLLVEIARKTGAKLEFSKRHAEGQTRLAQR